MFRVLLIIGLILSGALQGMKRGTVAADMATPAEIAQSVVQQAEIKDGSCCTEPAAINISYSHCQSECKGVIKYFALQHKSNSKHHRGVLYAAKNSADMIMELRPPIT